MHPGIKEEAHVEFALHITASGAFQKSVLGSVEVLRTYPVQLTVI